MKLKRVTDGLETLRGQLAASVRLRLGLLCILAILWAYGLLLSADYLADRQKLLASLGEQAARLAPVAREQRWPGRADEARRQLNALQSMVWVESDLGLVEARFQDWIRATAGSSGLVLRDLTFARVAAAPANAIAAAAPAASVAGRAGDVPQVITARLIIEMNRRDALFGFLAEMSRLDRAVMVDRLMVRTVTQPPVAEIDLRILARASTGAAN
jgi:hypothetical protein